MHTPRSPDSSGSDSTHLRGRDPQHVEGADQVDPDHGLERLRAGAGPGLRGGPLGPADAGAATRDPQPAGARAAASTARLHRVRRRSRRSRTNGARRARRRARVPLSSLRSAITTVAPRACSSARGRLAESRGAAGDECAAAFDLHQREPYRRAASDSANRPSGSVNQRSSAQPRRVRGRPSSRARVNFALISVRSSSPAANSTSQAEVVRSAPAAGAARAAASRSTRAGGRRTRRDRTRSGEKSASSSRLITCSTLRLNSAVTPGGVVVGGLDHARGP